MSGVFCLCIALVMSSSAGTSGTIHATNVAATSAVSSISVAGNKLIDGSGAPVQLRGVNRSGTEYACVEWGGPFDGPSDQTSVAAIAGWHVNAVRLGLNEDCWLGINGEPIGGLTAASYQSAIINYVNLLHANGLYAILELHWSAPGTVKATSQTTLPDYDHSPAMWASVAAAFKNDHATIFDVYNEPTNDGQHCGPTSPAACAADSQQNWWCWSHGQGCVTNDNSSFPQPWRIAGMEELIGAVRGAGASNVVLVGGLQYSNDFTSYLKYKPADSANQMAASFHVYNFASCNNLSCWNQTVAPVAAQIPVIAGEIGEDDGGHGLILDPFMAWADGKSISYLAWTWDTWGCGGPVLISNYNGTPCQTFGSGYQAHLAAVAGPSPTPSAAPSPSPSPSARPSPSPSPLPSPSPSPTSNACTLTFNGPMQSGTCVMNANGTVSFTQSGPSPSPSPVPSPSPLPSPSPSPSPLPSPSPTPSPSPLPSPSASPSPSPTPKVLIGTQTVTSSPDSNSPGSAQAFPYVAASSGTLSTLTAYLDTPNQAGSVLIGLYTDAGGNPSTLLATCTVVAPKAGAWSSCATSASVTAGTTYWLALLGPTGTGWIAFRDSPGTSGSKASIQSNLNALPATWTSTNMTWGNAPASIYASS